MKKVLFYGTPEYAAIILDSLIKSPDFQIQTVITQPDKKTGRKQILTPPPVKTLAQQHNIPVLQPESCKNNPNLLTQIRNFAPDFQIVAAYGHILPTELLQIATPINVHGSILPKYRGASPVQSAILNGDQKTGITIMHMTEKMDAGDIISTAELPINPIDTTATLMLKLADLGAKTLLETLKNFDSIQASPQNDSQATYCKKISRQDAEIDFTAQSAEEIFNKLRAFTPWPGIFTFFNGKRLKILQALPPVPAPPNTPSTPFALDKNTLAFPTKQGLFLAVEIQLEGKNPTSATDFIHGYQIPSLPA